MKNITELMQESIVNEGYGNSSQFGDISRNGVFIDYFGTPLKAGDKVVFLSKDFRDSRNFYRAEISELITSGSGEDFVIVKNVESPHTTGGKVKNGSKKRADLCIKINY